MNFNDYRPFSLFWENVILSFVTEHADAEEIEVFKSFNRKEVVERLSSAWNLSTVCLSSAHPVFKHISIYVTSSPWVILKNLTLTMYRDMSWSHYIMLFRSLAFLENFKQLKLENEGNKVGPHIMTVSFSMLNNIKSLKNLCIINYLLTAEQRNLLKRKWSCNEFDNLSLDQEGENEYVQEVWKQERFLNPSVGGYSFYLVRKAEFSYTPLL